LQNPKRFSVSRVDTFANVCERRYLWDCFKPWQETEDTKRGNDVHDALELTVCHRRVSGCSWEAAIEKAVDAMKDKLRVLSEKRLRIYLEQALPVLYTLTPVAEEEWFEDTPYRKWCGKIDVVSSTSPIEGRMGLPDGCVDIPCVLDWKTLRPGKRPWSDELAAKKMQLRVYCLAKGVRTGVYAFLPWAGEAIITRMDFTDEELRLTQRWIEETSRVIDERWAATRGPEDPSQFALCGTPGQGLCQKRFCDHWSKCLGQSDRKE
jgi:hypothetical protein